MRKASELVEKYDLVLGVGKAFGASVPLVVTSSIVRYSGAGDGPRVKQVYWACHPEWVGFHIMEHLVGKELLADLVSKTSYKISLVDNGVMAIGHASLRSITHGVDSMEPEVDFGFKGGSVFPLKGMTCEVTGLLLGRRFRFVLLKRTFLA